MANKTKVDVKSKAALSENGKMIALFMITTLLIVASFIFSREFIKDIQFNQKVISAKDKVNSTLGNNVDALPELTSNFNNLEKDGLTPEQVLTALPVSADYAGLSADIESIAAGNGAQLTGINIDTSSFVEGPLATSGVGFPQELVFQMSVVGSYPQLQNFIKGLEASMRPMVVTQVSVSGVEPALVAELTVTTFYQPATVIGNEVEVIKP